MATPRRPWTRRPQVIGLRTRSRLADAVVGTLDGFRVHQSSTGSTLVTYFGFISVFPLFLVFTTILGFVLEGDEQMKEDIVDSALSKLPLIGPKLAASPEALQGSVIALVVGLLLALWSGTKAFVALQTALDNTNEVPLEERNSFVQVRARALGGIVVIGLAQAGSAAINGVVTAAGLPALGDIALLVGTLLLNAAVLSFTYRWLTSREMTWRSVVPGSLLAGTAFSVLQILGTTIIARSQANAQSMYGDFTTTFTLLAWLSLHATMALMGAELNRSLVTSPYWSEDGTGSDPVAPEVAGVMDDSDERDSDERDSNEGDVDEGDVDERETDGSERGLDHAAADVAVESDEAGRVDQVVPRGRSAATAGVVGLIVVALLALLSRLTGRETEHVVDRP